MRSKLESYMGFAAKSGNVVSGTFACTDAMRRGRARLLIIAEDTAEGTKRKLCGEADKIKVPVRVYGRSDDLSRMVGKTGRSIFVIKDDNLAKVIDEQIEEGKKEVLG